MNILVGTVNSFWRRSSDKGSFFFAAKPDPLMETNTTFGGVSHEKSFISSIRRDGISNELIWTYS